MKMEVTRRGVYDAKGEKIEIGTVLTVKGDTVPGYLLNKAVEVKGERTEITNPALDRDELKKQAAELNLEYAPNIPSAKLKELIDAKLAE